MKFREFRKSTGRNARQNVWLIGTFGEVVVVRWGLVDGAFQETKDCPGTCGVEGHANFQTAEQYAIFCMERDIRKKKEMGYVEYIDGKPTSIAATSIDFSKPLPKNLTFYKPQLKITDKKLSKIHFPMWTLKRDGMMHIAVKHGDWKIYSRRMDVSTEKFPHIIQSLNKLNVPDDTIFLGEIVSIDKKGNEDFKKVSRVCRSDPELSLAYQGLGSFPRNKEPQLMGLAAFYVFDLAFYEGRNLIQYENARERFTLLRKIFNQLEPRLFVNTGVTATIENCKKENRYRRQMLHNFHIGPLEIIKTNETMDLDLARKLHVEGFVVIDTKSSYGDKAFSFDGKAQRPKGIWKRKPKYEDEFIIIDTYEGTGRNTGKLGGFLLEQIHPVTKQRINCGKCGGGFTDEQRVSFWGVRNTLIEKTIKMEFDSRQPPKDGAYAVRFPVFKGWADKTPEECIAQGI